MGLEVTALGISYLAAGLAFGTFLWRVFAKMFEGIERRFEGIERRFDEMDRTFGDRFDEMDRRFEVRLEEMDRRFDGRLEEMDRRFDGRFGEMGRRFDVLENKVDGLARNHQDLARELSEFRGEVRGRLALDPPPTAQASGGT